MNQDPQHPNKQELPPPGPKQPGRRNVPQRSNAYVFVWVVIFIILGSLLFFKDHDNVNNREIIQTQFEELLSKGSIATAKLTPESDDIFKVEGEFKGDAKSASIAAASIIAKVYRDRLMVKLDKIYPGYGLAENKGYGTARHLQALRELGVTPIHRRSFAPVRDILTPPPEQLELF